MISKTDEEKVEEVMKRVKANDASAMCFLSNLYHGGLRGLQQDQERAMELLTRAADLGHGEAQYNLGVYYYEGGDLKKAKFHYEAAAMKGNEQARCNLGLMEYDSNKERAFKHFTIAASAGHYRAMNALQKGFDRFFVSRDAIDAILAAYNNSCVEMRSEARDAFIKIYM